MTSRVIDMRGRPLAAKMFVKEVGICWNLLVVGAEEDTELLGWAVGSVLLNLAKEGAGGQ